MHSAKKKSKIRAILISSSLVLVTGVLVSALFIRSMIVAKDNEIYEQSTKISELTFSNDKLKEENVSLISKVDDLESKYSSLEEKYLNSDTSDSNIQFSGGSSPKAAAPSLFDTCGPFPAWSPGEEFMAKVKEQQICVNKWDQQYN